MSNNCLQRIQISVMFQLHELMFLFVTIDRMLSSSMFSDVDFSIGFWKSSGSAVCFVFHLSNKKKITFNTFIITCLNNSVMLSSSMFSTSRTLWKDDGSQSRNINIPSQTATF
jgi:hypothetical protein